MSKKLPPLETNEAARRFLESTDLTDYLDRTTRAPLTREFEAKDKALTLRPSEALLADTCSLRGGDVISPFMSNPALVRAPYHVPGERPDRSTNGYKPLKTADFRALWTLKQPQFS